MVTCMTKSEAKQELVFFDGEFSSLDPYVGELVSFGVVKESGEELYCELEYDGEYSDWMKENLVHTLIAPKVSRQQARDMLRTFAGALQPYVCAFVNHFDTVYLSKLFAEDIRKGETTLGPFHWMPVDFASVLYAKGIDPQRFPHDSVLLRDLGIDEKQFKHTHHALDDARLLRQAWRGLANNKQSLHDKV